MIRNLSGDYEKVEYENKRFVMLYNNIETELYPTHWHNAIEIIMPLVNPFTVFTGGREYKLDERDILIIPPGELHTLPPQAGRRIIFQCEYSTLEAIAPLEAILPVLNAPVVITPESGQQLCLHAKQCMLDIYTEYFDNNAISDVRIFLNLVSMLTAVREYQLEQCRQTLDCPKDKMQQYSEKFKLVLRYIDQNYMYDITLDTLASIAGYSKYHFSRIFKQFNAVSYIQYINIRRTRAAELLLMDRSLPITEVAMRAGFPSLSTFNRIFKEVKHCTPTTYQRYYRLPGSMDPPDES